MWLRLLFSHKWFRIAIETGILPIPSFEDIQEKRIVDTYKKKLGLNSLPGYLNKIIAATRVCYYNHYGEIIEDYQWRPGETLQQMCHSHNQHYTDYDFKNYADTYCSAIVIGRYNDFHKWIDNFDYEPYFSIDLPSDIWFPRVPGYLEKKAGVLSNPYFSNIWYDKGFDNRELAYEHTPRLNKFIAAIAQKVEEMGGTWSVSTDTNRRYYDMMTPTGIKLW